jgi:Tol biopolymer transport system component
VGYRRSLLGAFMIAVVGSAVLGAVSAASSGTAQARVARDGKIAFVRSGHLYTVSLDGSRPQRLRLITQDDLSVDGPAWSPDGNLLAFNASIATFDAQALHIREATGRLRVLFDTGRGEVGVSWSPDGEQLVVGSGGDVPALSLVSVATGQQTDISASGFDPAWSPDGAWIAYRFGQGYGKGVLVLRGLALVRPDGSGFRQVTRLGGDPSWSPDGRRIAYTELDRPGNIFTEMTGGSEQGISIVGRGGSHRIRLTTRRGDRDPAWSPSGRYIAFTRGSEHPALWIMRSNGTGQRLLTTNASKPAWQPLLP